MRHFLFMTLLFGALVLAPDAAHAHAANTSYLKITAPDRDGAVALVWDIGAADLDWAMDLDLDANGSVTWGEIKARRDTVESLAIQHLQIERGGKPCVVSSNDLALTRHIDATFVSLGLTARCTAGGVLSVGSSLFFAQDASQRVLLHASVGGQAFNSVISPQAPRWIQPAVSSGFETFARFVQQGVVHVWSGYDHIAFVLLLILPSVLRRAVQDSPRAIAKNLLSVVTTFTVAHSVTLSLAATHVVELPERWVETAIAMSIVVAALMNIKATPTYWRLAVAFVFGLMHGFGFARSLVEIDIPGARMLPMLAGFNVGVEIAQLIIVMIALPLLLRWAAIRERLLREGALARFSPTDRGAIRRGSSCSSGS